MDSAVTRDEMNRLLADVAALRKLVVEDVGHRWGSDLVRSWHDRAVTAHEIAMADNPTVSANVTRALDKLADQLLRATR